MRRADLAERIDTVEHRMDSMEQRLDASFNALSTQILQSRRETGDAILGLRGEMKVLGADLRAEMKVLGTDLRTAIREGDEALGTDLRIAIREGDEERRRFMRILHEDVLSRFTLIGEGRPSSS